MRKIGLARIDAMANQIKLKSQQVFKECMVKVKFPDGIITPFVKPEKQFNQTCFMYAKSKWVKMWLLKRIWKFPLFNFSWSLKVNHGLVEAEQLIRWKQQYPSWRLSNNSHLTKHGKNMPNFCSKTDGKTLFFHFFFRNFLI